MEHRADLPSVRMSGSRTDRLVRPHRLWRHVHEDAGLSVTSGLAMRDHGATLLSCAPPGPSALPLYSPCSQALVQAASMPLQAPRTPTGPPRGSLFRRLLRLLRLRRR